MGGNGPSPLCRTNHQTDFVSLLRTAPLNPLKLLTDLSGARIWGGFMKRAYIAGASIGAALFTAGNPAAAQTCTTTGTDRTCTNTGSLATFTNIPSGTQNATSTNTGTVSAGIDTETSGAGNVAVTNSGSITGGFNSSGTIYGISQAPMTLAMPRPLIPGRSASAAISVTACSPMPMAAARPQQIAGTIGVDGSGATGIVTNANGGNAATTNSGTISIRGDEATAI